MEKLNYWKKDKKFFESSKDITWNFPEQKTGTIAIIGGNSASFSTEIKTSEFIIKNYPFIKNVINIFPDSLKKQLPPLENIFFYESTESGSFKRSFELRNSLNEVDYCLFLGDFSKNSETSLAISDLIKNTEKPMLITRDTIDLIKNETEQICEKQNIIFFGSLIQIQTLLRSLYYPKVLLLSQPLLPTLETLHKFTLSYNISIMTFHEGKIISANSGQISTVDISQTKYSPISLWNGELAAKVSIYSMFNSSKPLESLTASLLV